jgi:hypothetical protein
LRGDPKVSITPPVKDFIIQYKGKEKGKKKPKLFKFKDRWRIGKS